MDTPYFDGMFMKQFTMPVYYYYYYYYHYYYFIFLRGGGGVNNMLSMAINVL